VLTSLVEARPTRRRSPTSPTACRAKVDVVVLGSGGDGARAPRRAVSPRLVARGVKAGQIVKTAAQVVGGGGGGATRWRRPAAATPSKLPEALDAAREAIAAALGAA
jgi:alanyl-tRNA synthetase